MCNLHSQFPFNRLLNLEQSWVAILHHLAGVEVHKMVMLAEFVRAFVLGAVVSELVFDHQIAVQEQFDGVVQGGTAYTVLPVFHLVVELLDVEMPVSVIDLLQDGETLRSFAEIVVVEVFGEYLFDRQCDCFVGFFHI